MPPSAARPPAEPRSSRAAPAKSATRVPPGHRTAGPIQSPVPPRRSATAAAGPAGERESSGVRRGRAPPPGAGHPRGQRRKPCRFAPTSPPPPPQPATRVTTASRPGHPPHIVQVFEVGTATMMSAKGAGKPFYQLMADAGEPFDPQNYLPTVTGYYSTADGKMLSMPFNSSTAIVYWNKDAFTKAGLDPEKPPKTWPETFAAAKKLKVGGANCGVVPAWITWTQIEQFDAWHNLPLATMAT